MNALRIQSKSLGAFDFRNGKKGLYGLKGSAAVKGTALDDALFGTILLPDSMSPRAVDLLPIFYTGVPNVIPYQLATGKGGNPLAAGKPFINNFLPTLGDMLRLNMAVPVTPRNSKDFSSLGIVNAAVLGLTDARFNGDASLQFIPNMDGFPNGRRLEDDVTTIELQAVSGVALAAIGLWYDDYIPGTSPSPVTTNLVSVLSFNAGVTHNDTTFKTNFPYVQTPWRGFIGAGYVGPVNTPLPVSFVDFEANANGNKVMLNWEVANEQSVNRYEIEQSTGGGNFTTIGTVNAGNGKSYSFVDLSPSATQTNYYRIKQVSATGFSYSPVRAVKFATKNSISVFPNPASSFVNVTSLKDSLDVFIYDVSGKQIASKLNESGTIHFDISSLAKGSYLIVAKSNGQTVDTKKIVKE